MTGNSKLAFFFFLKIDLQSANVVAAGSVYSGMIQKMTMFFKQQRKNLRRAAE